MGHSLPLKAGVDSCNALLPLLSRGCSSPALWGSNPWGLPMKQAALTDDSFQADEGRPCPG